MFLLLPGALGEPFGEPERESVRESVNEPVAEPFRLAEREPNARLEDHSSSFVEIERCCACP